MPRSGPETTPSSVVSTSVVACGVTTCCVVFVWVGVSEIQVIVKLTFPLDVVVRYVPFVPAATSPNVWQSLPCAGAAGFDGAERLRVAPFETGTRRTASKQPMTMRRMDGPLL